jgi:alpha-galactosidase
MWAMMAAPLLIGTDLRRASADTLRILSNAEIIAVDQDRLGVQAQVLFNLAGKMVLGRPLADGDRAVALYNSTAAPATISIRAVQTGLPLAGAYRLNNLWTGETTQASNTISASVPPHATVMYRVRPLHDADRLPPATTLGVDATGAVPGAAGPALVAGQPGPLTATFTNLGADPVRSVTLSAQLPPGFTLASDGDTSARSVASGGSFAARWTSGSARTPHLAAMT